MNDRIFKFLYLLKSKYEVQIKYKTSSSFMKFLSYILFFVPDFMTRFTTTIGSTIYFPNEEALKDEGKIVTLAHEVRHIHDSQLDKLYNLKYLFPQVFSILFFVLSFVSLWFLIPSFILLAPLPAYWRMKIELKGYTTSLFILNLMLKEKEEHLENRLKILLDRADKINGNFTGPSYYFMWAFGVRSHLADIVYKILEEKLEKEDSFYMFIKDCFNQSKPS